MKAARLEKKKKKKKKKSFPHTLVGFIQVTQIEQVFDQHSDRMKNREGGEVVTYKTGVLHTILSVERDIDSIERMNKMSRRTKNR